MSLINDSGVHERGWFAKFKPAGWRRIVTERAMARAQLGAGRAVPLAAENSDTGGCCSLGQSGRPRPVGRHGLGDEVGRSAVFGIEWKMVALYYA